MIKLSELLNTVKHEKEKGLVPIENWRLTDVLHLEDIGFKQSGGYEFSLQNPELIISFKKGTGFILTDMSKKIKTEHANFSMLSDYLEKYPQEFDNEPYTKD